MNTYSSINPDQLKLWAKNEFQIELSNVQVNEILQQKYLTKIFSYLMLRVKNRKNSKIFKNFYTKMKISGQIDLNNKIFKESLNDSMSEMKKSKFESNLDDFHQFRQLFSMMSRSRKILEHPKFTQEDLSKGSKTSEEIIELIDIILDKNRLITKQTNPSDQSGQHLTIEEIADQLKLLSQSISSKIVNIKQLSSSTEESIDDNSLEHNHSLVSDSQADARQSTDIMTELVSLEKLQKTWTALIDRIENSQLLSSDSA
ncbi:hypothetical protein NH340_JMT02013 [Sarcoptes scabiei]|nr:hypothetical protein NH340_JMT02013 [Sarcoptes scabiei]